METPGFHIFREQLRGRAIDFSAIRAAWTSLSDERLTAYGQVIPAEWAAADDAVGRALALIKGARDNIDGCLSGVQRVLL
jgi:hypothetical protein